MSSSKGIISGRKFQLIRINRIFDIVWIFSSLYLLVELRAGQVADITWPGVIAALVFTLFAHLNQLYRSWRVAPLHDELSVLWRSWFAALLILVLVLYVFDALFPLDKTTVLVWAIVAPLMMLFARIVERVALRLGRKSGRSFRSAAVVGMNDIGHRVADRIIFNRWMGVRLLGYFDERTLNHERLTVGGSVPFLGNIDDLLSMAMRGEIDIVYVALPMRAESRIKELIERLSDSMVSVYFVADFAVFDFLRAQWETLSEMPVLRVIDSPFDGFNGFSKRLQDICLASVMFVITAIPMMLITVAIRLGSPGPAICRQVRQDLDGNEFTIYKFRTVTAGGGIGQPGSGERDRDELTRLGAFLRRTSLDDLPQLINVLQGRMSMVGPGAHALKPSDDNASLIQRFVLHHNIRPGITGWSQINELHGRTDTPERIRSRVEYDLEYINNWSFWFDLRILILTAVRAWRGRNAIHDS